MTLPARGTPDWGAPSYEASAAQVDLGQVLSGLYHFDRVDQRGRIATVETWGEGAMSWALGQAGAGALPDVASAPLIAPFVPPSCLRLLPGPLTTDTSTAGRAVALGQSKRIGLEIGMACRSVSGNFNVKIEYLTADGAKYIMRLLYNVNAGNWRVGTPGGEVVFATRPVTSNNTWQQAKIVGDWTTGRYVRAIVGDTEFDVTAQSLAASALTEVGQCIVTITSAGGLAGNAPTFNGYLVVSRDEP